MKVGKAPDVVYTENLEYVVDSRAYLHIWCGFQNADACVFRKAEESRVIDGIITFAQPSPQALKIYYLSQSCTLDEGNTIEKHTVAQYVKSPDM